MIQPYIRQIKLFFLILSFSCLAWAQNPLLSYSHLNSAVYDYSTLSAQSIKSLYLAEIPKAQALLTNIAQQEAAPTYANTIAPLEHFDLAIEELESLADHLAMVTGAEPYLLLRKELAPLTQELGLNLFNNPQLFARVQALKAQSQQLALTTEQQSFLNRLYQEFIRNGSSLNDQQKKRLLVIDQSISDLEKSFEDNITAGRDKNFVLVTQIEDLKGLPARIIDGAAKKAQELKLEGWALTTDNHVYSAVVSYAENRGLRKKLYDLANQMYQQSPSDNREIILKIVKLRQERATLLGYETHAHYQLELRMAQNPATVNQFLNSLAQFYFPLAQQELAELQAFAKPDLPDSNEPLQSYDLEYYSEKFRQAKYGYSQEDFRPYLAYSSVLKAALKVLTQKFGFQFVEQSALPTWHADVKVFAVTNAQHQLLAWLYIDPFKRVGKRAGAWHHAIVSSGSLVRDSGQPPQRQIPIINIVANLTPPSNDQNDALLNLSEATTLFHELGHASHSFASQVTNPKLAGTRVATDFVELPSKLNEYWLTEPEVLNSFARHYQTQEPIPAELVNKMRNAQKFRAGLSGIARVRSSLVDMAWHSVDFNSFATFDQAQQIERNAIQHLKLVDGPFISRALSFSHIFAGSYSAGYYSYLWSDNLGADAFLLFKEKGIFDRETLARFQNEVLAKGSSQPASELYRNFRGQDPNPSALLICQQLLDPAQKK